MEGIARFLAKTMCLKIMRENCKSQMHTLYCIYDTDRREADPKPLVTYYTPTKIAFNLTHKQFDMAIYKA